MTRFAKYLAYAGLLMAVSCNGPSVLTLGQTYTLQGVIADAATGARVGGGDLKLYLVQGSDVRGPSRLVTSGDLMGEYAFTGIPVDYAGAGAPENLWKVVVVKGGYQRFESEVHFQATGVNPTGNGTNADEVVQQVFSKIGNVYLFPVGAVAPDYTFAATFNGKPVAGATVQLDPVGASNSAIFVQGSSTLPATNGYVPSLSHQTDPAGRVVFTGAELALGAAYKVQVLPFSYKETSTSTAIQLGLLNLPTTGGGSIPLIIAGLSSVNQPLFLVDLTPAQTNEPIFIVDASNRALDSLQPSGTLVLTFNLPVTLVNPNNFGATISGFQANGTTPTAAALNGTQPVTATLDSTGTILTLAPNYTTPPAPTDRSITMTYSGGTAGVVPQGYPNKVFNPFTLHFNDGVTTPSGVVHVTGP